MPAWTSCHNQARLARCPRHSPGQVHLASPLPMSSFRPFGLHLLSWIFSSVQPVRLCIHPWKQDRFSEKPTETCQLFHCCQRALWCSAVGLRIQAQVEDMGLIVPIRCHFHRGPGARLVEWDNFYCLSSQFNLWTAVGDNIRKDV